MISENRARELAIRWYIIALNAERKDKDKAPPAFAKAHAFIHVLDLPSDISCGKKSEDGLKRYAKNVHSAWMNIANEDPDACITEWMDSNVKTDFENHI